MKSLVPGCLAIAVVLHTAVPSPGQEIDLTYTQPPVVYGIASPPLGVSYLDREFIFSSHLLPTEIAIPIRDNGGPNTTSGFLGFPPGSTFGQQLVDDFVGLSNLQFLFHQGFLGDAQSALLAGFADYEADLEAATGLNFIASISFPNYQGTVTTVLEGGLVTAPPPPGSGLEGTPTPFFLRGTVSTDLLRMDVTFQVVPEPSTLSLLACVGWLLPLAAKRRRR